PESLLPWLASWIDVTVDPALPEQRRRELVRRGAELYRWRGTRKGLAEHLRICTGNPAEISEQLPGMRLGPDTRLGVNTVLGSSGGGYHFTVTVHLSDDSAAEVDWIRAVIDAHKPAHTVYTLNITKTEREAEGSDGG
ncbi:MAG: hypothetical protein IBX68_10650, partial [Dehalococcoidia bacterium]|nr:hypothetical protein [Dehalococcoidia bacterium]